MMSLRAARGGFTLIEVLAAIVIAGLIVTAVYGVVSSTITAQRHTEDIMGVRKEGAAILDLVCEDLFGAVFLEKRVCFAVEDEGDPKPFGFIAVTWNPASGKRVLGEVGYTFEPVDTTLQLYRRFGFLEGSILKGGEEILVSDEIHSWKTEFFDGEEWVDAWENAKSLPMAVRIEFALNAPVGEPVTFKREMPLMASNLVKRVSLPEEPEL